ncbi:hypothetical protein Adt_30893 [Abeliophyllum distichum]|uniref:Uncharacterized protein n=1 Tax=Abeliophyllum distichum TaxID=126358 RepID=A0ABD1RCI9_9LAMI
MVCQVLQEVIGRSTARYKVAEFQWEWLLREALLHGRSKLRGGRVPMGEALAQSVVPWEEQAARWPSPSGRGSCAKRYSMERASYKVVESPWERLLHEALLHGSSKLQGGQVPMGEALARSVVSMGGASCKVAKSSWKGLLHEALLHGRSKLQGGQVPVGEALA